MARSKGSFIARWRTKDYLTPARLLIAAAIFHLALTITIFGLGRFEVLPGVIDRDGNALSFTSDSETYHGDASELSETLGRGMFISWASAPQPLHVKLYSICFTLFGPLLGHNILSVEPLNLFYYLAILMLVFHLGRETFNHRVGLIAAITVACWPSLLLHTTQLLHDQLFIVGMLAFLLIMLRWQTRTYSWREALSGAAAGGLSAILTWLARPRLVGVMIVAGLLGAGLFVFKQFFERRVQAANLFGLALMLALTVGAVKVVPKFQAREKREPGVEEAIKEPMPGTLLGRLPARVARMRHMFIQEFPEAGSNIDGDVEFHSTMDIIGYLPRAALIGFFAPFPDMWLASGKMVGSSGRLLIGAECLLMYLVEALALYALWLRRRELTVWLLFLLSAIGMWALGLVVVNVGALYRIRYLFLIIIIILAAEGAAHALGRIVMKPEAAEELDAPS